MYCRLNGIQFATATYHNTSILGPIVDSRFTRKINQMSIVVEKNVPLPAPSKRTRNVVTPYGTFFAEAREHGDSFVIPCPASRVRDAELAKAWISSTRGNVKQYAKRLGIVAIAEQTTENSEVNPTGLGVRVWYDREMTAEEIADRDAK